MTEFEADHSRLAMAAEVVAAYISRNSVPVGELPGLIQSVHGALNALATGAHLPPEPEPLTPAVPIKKSIQRDRIICLEDGKSFQSLRRHLQTSHSMTPNEYRAKWGVRAVYPMVAPAYAEARSTLAKAIGLGRKAAPTVETPEPEPAKAKAPRRRGKAAA